MNTKPLPPQSMLPRDIPDGPWIVIADNYLIQKGKDYLIICILFSKYPFLYKVSTKSSQSPSQPLQDLISQYRLSCLLYTNNGPQFTSNEQFTPTPGKCPAMEQSCYACSGHNHYTSLWKQCNKTQWPSMVVEATEEENHQRTTSPGPTETTSVVLASPQTGVNAAALPVMVSPTELPTAPPVVLPPISLTDLITDPGSSSTPRTALK